jgi:hypothetical protein
MHKPDEIALKLLGIPFDDLDKSTKRVARQVAARTHISSPLLP